MKKILSLTLALLLMFSVVPIASLTASAQETKPKTSLANNNVKLKSDSGISSLLQTAIEQENDANDEDIANQILDVSVENKTATVKFNNNVACKLIVAIYDETTGDMSGSGIKSVEKDAEEADVTLDIETMPEYFTVKVFILDENNKPLNKSFESIYYTKAHQEFLKKTTDDFNQDKVLNLDEDKNNNFAVFDDDTKQIEETEKNKLESKDDETKTYTFSNIDSKISSLQTDDDFYYEYDNTYIIVKVKTITIDGTNATIVGEQDVELDDVFSFVKIDTTSNGAGTTVDMSTADEGVTYEGSVSPQKYKNKYLSSVDADSSITHKYKVEKEIKSKDETKKIKFGCSAEIKIGISLKAELYWNYFSIEFKVSSELKTSVSVSGSIESTKIPLGKQKVPLGATGLTAGFDVDFLAEFSAAVDVNLKQTSAICVGYDTKQGFFNNSEPTRTTSALNVEGKLFIGVKLSPNVDLLDIVKVSLSGSNGLEIKAMNFKKSELDPEKERHDCDLCIDGSVKYKIDIKFALEFKLLIFNKTGVEYKLTNFEKKLFDWYYNNSGFGIGKCPNTSYKVIFTIKNTKGEKLANASVDGEKVKSDGTLSMFRSPNNNGFTIKCEGYKTQVVCYDIEKDINKFTVTLYKTTESGGNVTEIGVLNEGNYEYTVLSNGTAKITKYKGNAKTLKIPSKLGGYKVTSIGGSAFENCTSLTSIIIPNSVTSIGSWAFSGCTSLTSITIPNSVTSIGSSAFYGCKSLTSITIPNSVTSIDTSTFNGCSKLTSITLPNSVTSIGSWAFEGCTSLTSITIPNSVTSIGKQTFYNCKSLTSITIPNSVTSIGYEAFYNCSSLNKVNISDISNWCNINFNDSLSNPLYYAKKLYLNNQLVVNLVIPNSVTSIGEYAFYNCTSLTSITIGNNVTSIGNSAFLGCTSLTNITIPNSVTRIDNAAFENCTSLTSIIIPNSVTRIGSWAFSGCSKLESITIPDSIIDIYNNAFEDTAYYKNSTNWENNILYIGDYLIDVKNNADGKYTIKNGVTRLAFASFNGTLVKNIEIPNSVVYLGGAFNGCTSLTSIILPNSITSIGNSEFWDCTSLTNITIPNSVTSIDNAAFEYCSSLTSITIPNSVTDIGDSAFFGCSSLTSITIPDSIINIGYRAFYSCTSLKNVYYNGTQEQWNRIGIGTYNECLTSATIHYNSSGVNSYSLNKFNAKKYLANDSNENEIEYKSFSQTGLVPNQVYVLMIIAGNESDYSVDTSSLKYITDEYSDENGNVNFKYRYNGDDEIIAVVFGAKNYKITIGDNVYESNDEIFTFPQSTENGFIAYTDGVNYYDAGEKIVVSSDESFSTVSIGKVQMLEGASIRLKAVSGMRFYTQVDTDKLSTLPADAVVSKGTLITVKDLKGDNDLTLDSTYQTVNVKYKSDEYFENNNTFVGSIVNIKDNNITRDFVGRGYVTVKLGNIEKTIYADYYNNDVENNTRTIANIAKAYKLDNASDYNNQDDAHKTLVNKWAEQAN